MIKDDNETVSALRLAVRDKVGNERFELWFSAAQFSLAAETLTLRVPDQFLLDWLRGNFRRELNEACQTVLGRTLSLEFVLDASAVITTNGAGAAAASQNGGMTATAANNSTALAVAEPANCLPRQSCLEPAATLPFGPAAPLQRRKYESLATFVVGDSNRVAHASAQTAAAQPGAYSPLVFHGTTGVGKTHLLEGILTTARAARPNIQAVYLSAEQFTSYFLEALRGSGLPSFRRKYRGVELLLIDDMQFFMGKRATLVELQHTLDTLLREGRQLVFTCDRSPADMAELGPELKTRLMGGLVCRLDPPDFETRRGIIAGLVTKMQLNVPEDVRVYLAGHFTSHARELVGALKRLEASSRAWDKPITLSLAEEALGELIRAGARNVRIGDIERAVCQVFNLSPECLQSTRKGKEVSHPRMLAMWLARKHTRAALSEIGHHFGGRSHSTVISAQKNINQWMVAHRPLELTDRNWNLEDAIRQVEERLQVG